MANNCPSNCQDLILVGNPAQCEITERNRILARVAFYPCNETLPSPITNPAIKALFDSGVIRASNELFNLVWADPTFEDVGISDCRPNRRVVTGRELTFEDRVKVSFVSGSPSASDDYYDYTFWQDKIINQGLMNYMLIFCDGDVIIPTDINGNPLTATMDVYITYQKPANPGGLGVEIKRGSIRFNNDPIALYTAVPAFNINDAGIIL